MRIEYTKEFEIRSIHNLSHPDLSPDENAKLYGICYRRHGHHYKVRVTIQGKLDEKSGLLTDRDWMDTLVRREVVDKLDGMDLNRIFPNSSCEALAYDLFQMLMPLFPVQMLRRISIQETGKNYIEYPSA